MNEQLITLQLITLRDYLKKWSIDLTVMAEKEPGTDSCNAWYLRGQAAGTSVAAAWLDDVLDGEDIVSALREVDAEDFNKGA